MSTTSARTINITFTGDVNANNTLAASSNTVTPAQIDIVTLASGNNTITAPSVSGITNKAVTISPPAANTTLITAKGSTGDTGIALHKTDPTSIAIDTTQTSIVLNAAGTIAGVRLIWS